MDRFEGKTALITGAASGIGLAMAERFAAEGMELVLVDIDQAALDDVTARLGGTGHVVDVTDIDALEALAGTVGDVHVLCPNAGVGPVGPILEFSRENWDWLLGVNLQHVIHLTRLFGPRLVAQADGHIVFTASGAGIMAVPTLGPYCVTKHGVVALAETLFLELQGTGVGVSVLCPGLVKTGIFASERNRPDRFGGPTTEADALQQGHQTMLEGMGIDPAIVADQVLQAVREGTFWILPHEELKPMVTTRAETIVNGTNPGGLDLG
ncbi:MAG TPA: SDR family NAD(P)-dependent oxidoreductase [Acidimicrobiales bacterium]|jgi:NAD(P)-dependent dehydrogenase (short-subunit alcohol dehydrogenase family)